MVDLIMNGTLRAAHAIHYKPISQQIRREILTLVTNLGMARRTGTKRVAISDVIDPIKAGHSIIVRFSLP